MSSLSKCRDCRRAVSQQAEACPSCGCPEPWKSHEYLKREHDAGVEQQSNALRQSQKVFIICFATIGLLVLANVGVGLLHKNAGGLFALLNILILIPLLLAFPFLVDQTDP